MKALYEQTNDGFLGTCVQLMGRMLNTVPAGVVLKESLTPLSVKPVNVTYDLDKDMRLVLSGKIRVGDFLNINSVVWNHLGTQIEKSPCAGY